MQRRLFLLAVGLILPFFMKTGVYGLGIGIHFNGGYAGENWNIYGPRETPMKINPMYPKRNAFYGNGYFIGGGFIIDTCVAGDRLVNFRVKGGYHYFPAKIDVQMKMHRADASFIAGFGLLRTKRLRLWLGPELGVQYLNGKGSYRSIDPSYLIVVGVLHHSTVKEEYNHGRLDLGLALGLNIHLGKSLSLSVEGSGGYGLGLGTVTQKLNCIAAQFNPSTGTLATALPYTGRKNLKLFSHGWKGGGTLSVIYRVKDDYRSKK